MKSTRSFTRLAATLVLAGHATAQVSFTPIGDLPGGSFQSRAAGISADGLSVVGQSISGSGSEGYRWTLAAGMVALGDLAGGTFSSDATGTSADGLVVVGTGNYETNTQAYRFAGAGPMAGLPFLPTGGYASSGYAVSNDGNTVVGQNLFSGPPPALPIIEAFRWTNPGAGGSGTQSLGFLPGGSFSSTARGASADGAVVVGWSDASGGTLPFRWRQSTGTMEALEPLPAGGTAGFARACSADGNVVVGSVNITGGSLAYRWTDPGGFETLPALAGAAFSNAADVSGDGEVVVGINSGGTLTGTIAVVWDADFPGGWRSLKQALLDAGVTSVADWTLLRAMSVSADGTRIAGDGTNPGGQTEAFVAVLPRGGACAADFNGVGGATVQDIYDYLTAWSAGEASADFNGVGGVTVQDIYDFLTAWSAGCG